MSDTQLTLNETTGVATVQFTRAGNPVPGPVDSVTKAPVAPVVVSDHTEVVTVAAGVDAGNGKFTYALTTVSPGTGVSISVSPLVNSDGTAINLPVPAPVLVDVVPGAADGLSLTVTA